MVGHGLVCSRNLVFILHLYLVFGGNFINCYKLYKSAKSPAALISVTNEANVVKIQNIKISRQRSTVKEHQLTSSFLILHGMKLFLNTSTAALLISLSGDVENNPGPFDTAILNPENSTINRQSTLRDSRSTVNCVPWFQRFTFIIFIAKGRGKINLWLKAAIDSSSRANQFELGSDPDSVS